MSVFKYITTADECKELETKFRVIQGFIEKQGFLPASITYDAVANNNIQEIVGWIVEFKTYLPKKEDDNK